MKFPADLAATIARAGWLVDLLSPDRERFHDRTLEEALAWCLVWLMAEELSGLSPAGSTFGASADPLLSIRPVPQRHPTRT